MSEPETKKEPKDTMPSKELYMIPASVLAAAIAGVDSLMASAQTVVDSNTGVTPGLIVNASIVLGAMLAIFHAGGIFRSWLETVKIAEEIAATVDDIQKRQQSQDERLVEVEAEQSRHHERISNLDSVVEMLKLRGGGGRQGRDSA